MDVTDNATVQETIEFIRQVMSGRCDILDLQAIREAIDRCLGTEDDDEQERSSH